MKLLIILSGISTLLILGFLPEHLVKRRKSLQGFIFALLFITINFKVESYLVDIDSPKTFDIEQVVYQENQATQLIYLDDSQQEQQIDLTTYHYDKNDLLEKGSITQHVFAKQHTLVIFNRIRIPLTQTKPVNNHTIHLFNDEN